MAAFFFIFFLCISLNSFIQQVNAKWELQEFDFCEHAATMPYKQSTRCVIRTTCYQTIKGAIVAAGKVCTGHDVVPQEGGARFPFGGIYKPCPENKVEETHCTGTKGSWYSRKKEQFKGYLAICEPRAYHYRSPGGRDEIQREPLSGSSTAIMYEADGTYPYNSETRHCVEKSADDKCLTEHEYLPDIFKTLENPLTATYQQIKVYFDGKCGEFNRDCIAWGVEPLSFLASSVVFSALCGAPRPPTDAAQQQLQNRLDDMRKMEEELIEINEMDVLRTYLREKRKRTQMHDVN